LSQASAVTPSMEALLSTPWLVSVEERLASVIRSEGPATQAIMAYITSTRGKRLRPLLVYLCARAFSAEHKGSANGTAGGSDARLVDLGAAVELVHLASLLHDDVVDGAAERRGMPTVSSVWGPGTSVLSGDYLFAAAFEMLVNSRLYLALGALSGALRSMSEAEVEQLASLFDATPDEARYWRCVRGKTASLFGAACEAGAAVGGAGPVQRALARSFGVHLGSAFQVADDLADVAGDPDSIGKPVGQDLGRGLVTLPVIFLLGRTEHAGRLRCMLARRVASAQDAAWVRDIAIASGGAAYAQAAAVRCIERANDCLNALHNSGHTQARAMLRPLADYVLSNAAHTAGPGAAGADHSLAGCDTVGMDPAGYDTAGYDLARPAPPPGPA
jgi:geranylgeranyl pyrophosphate synthase